MKVSGPSGLYIPETPAFSEEDDVRLDEARTLVHPPC